MEFVMILTALNFALMPITGLFLVAAITNRKQHQQAVADFEELINKYMVKNRRRFK